MNDEPQNVRHIGYVTEPGEAAVLGIEVASIDDTALVVLTSVDGGMLIDIADTGGPFRAAVVFDARGLLTLKAKLDEAYRHMLGLQQTLDLAAKNDPDHKG